MQNSDAQQNNPDLIEKMCREYIGYKQNGEHPWDNPDKRADDFAFHLRERMRRVLKVVDGYKKWMGKADWIWDEELQCHIPSCTYPSFGSDKYWDRCGNGPLTTPEEIESGICGIHK